MKNKAIKIGIFATAVLVGTFFIINYLRGSDIFNKEADYIAYYESVEGLVASAPVNIKGFKAGTVSSVVYDSDNGRFEVECSISKDFKIPEDSKLVIYGVDIMGGKGIRVDYGTSGEIAQDGAVLKGAYEPDLISSLTSSLGPLLTGINSTMDSLNMTISSINDILGDGNKAAISSLLRHLERTSANIDSFTATIKGKSSDFENFITNLNGLSVKLNSVAEKADSALVNVGQVTASLSESDIKGLVLSMHNLLDGLQDPDGSLGKLLSDDSVYNNVESLLGDIDSLIKEIEKNPKKYIKISIF